MAQLWNRISALVRAIQSDDGTMVEQAILDLSASRRIFAPLAFGIGAALLLLDGLKLLLTNWRLLLIQIPPAMWIWIAMFDLKVHVLHGRSFHVLHGLALVPVILAIMVVTVICFFLNAVFAFAIAQPGRPSVRPAFETARKHLTPIIVSGSVIGLMLGLATTVMTRFRPPAFSLSLGIVVGIMMMSYVMLPTRLTGAKSDASTRDKFTTAVVGGAFGAAIALPPYVIERVGILMLGAHFWLVFLVGVVLLSLGAVLQAGTTGAVRAVKLSAKLAAGNMREAGDGGEGSDTATIQNLG